VEVAWVPHSKLEIDRHQQPGRQGSPTTGMASVCSFLVWQAQCQARESTPSPLQLTATPKVDDTISVFRDREPYAVTPQAPDGSLKDLPLEYCTPGTGQGGLMPTFPLESGAGIISPSHRWGCCLAGCFPQLPSVPQTSHSDRPPRFIWQAQCLSTLGADVSQIDLFGGLSGFSFFTWNSLEKSIAADHVSRCTFL